MSTAAAATTTTTRTALPPGAWQLDPLHSTAAFAVQHNGISLFRGGFEDVTARLDVADDGTGQLTGAVRADSLVVRDETLAAHLRAPDFFDTERFPEIRFTSSAVRRDGDELVVEGELTIKDHTRPVTGRGTMSDVIEDPFGGTRIALALAATIDRTEFGMDWNMPMPGSGGPYLAREVALSLALELVKA